MIQIESKVNREDYIQYNVDYMNHTKKGKEQKLVLMSSPWIGAIICYLACAFQEQDVEGYIALGITAVFLVVFCCFFSWLINRNIPKRIQRSIAKMEKTNSFLYAPESIITLEDEWVEEKSERETIRVHYDQVFEVLILPHAIYIFESFQRAFLLPTRCFSSERERKELIEFLKEKVKTVKCFEK